jgi:hypothetical protein
MPGHVAAEDILLAARQWHDPSFYAAWLARDGVDIHLAEASALETVQQINALDFEPARFLVRHWGDVAYRGTAQIGLGQVDVHAVTRQPGGIEAGIVPLPRPSADGSRAGSGAGAEGGGSVPGCGRVQRPRDRLLHKLQLPHRLDPALTTPDHSYPVHTLVATL